jgi:hypothetical protein
LKRCKVVNGIAIHNRNRFSCYVKESDTKGLATLDHWVEWFTSKGIACVIAETDKGFAVYRLGLQDDDEE